MANSHDLDLQDPQHTLLTAIERVVDAAVAPLREEVERLRGIVSDPIVSDPTASTRAALGPDQLIPYGAFLKANGLSYELGQRLRNEGRLKVLQAGGKLVVRRGHAEEFVRKLPLAA